MGSRTLPGSIFLPSGTDAHDRALNAAIVDMYRLIERRVNSEITSDTFANRPTSDGSSRFFFATDTDALYFDEPTGWTLIAAPSGSTLQNLVIEAPAAGDTDPWLEFSIVSGGKFIIGIDDSDSDALVISTGAVLGTANAFRLQVGLITFPAGSVSVTGGNFDITRASSGGTVQYLVSNTSNTASSDALMRATVAGTAAGDPFLTFTIAGSTVFSLGIDNSVSGDPFTIAASATLGTSNMLTISTTDVTLPNSTTLALTQAQGAICQIKTYREVLTTSANPTDSTTNLLPANSLILDVSVRVTTALAGTLTTFSVGDPTTPGRFSVATSKAINSTSIGILHWSGVVTTLAAGPSQLAADKVRIDPIVGTLTGGVVEIVVHAMEFIAPTS